MTKSGKPVNVFYGQVVVDTDNQVHKTECDNIREVAHLYSDRQLHQEPENHNLLHTIRNFHLHRNKSTGSGEKNLS